MKFVAHSGLSNLHNQGVCVMQQYAMNTFVSLEFLSENLTLHKVSAARNLNNGTKCVGFSQQGSDPNDPFIADDADSERLTIRRSGNVEDHSVLRKEDFTYPVADLIQHCPFHQREWLQMWSEDSIFLRG